MVPEMQYMMYSDFSLQRENLPMVFSIKDYIDCDIILIRFLVISWIVIKIVGSIGRYTIELGITYVHLCSYTPAVTI